MKQFVIYLIFLAAFSNLKAQAPCAVFYSELGERFTVYMDGIAQHQYMESNVKILDIGGLSHNVRIAFENGFIEDVNKSINLANGTESSFMIHKKSGRYDMSPKNQIPLSQASRSANTNVQNVVTYRGNTPVTTTSSSSSSGFDDGGNNGNASIGINMGVGGEGGNVNVSVNISDNSGGKKTNNSSSSVSSSNNGQVNNNASSKSNNSSGTVSMSGSISGSNQSSGQKTNNTSGGGNHNNDMTATRQPNIVPVEGGDLHTKPIKQTTPVVAGYNGRIGCTNPMGNDAFQKAKESIQAKNFSSAQLTVAKQVIDANCLIVSQIKEIMKIFDFEDSRLEFAKYAYRKTYDLDNYYQVNDAFEFEGSVSRLDEFIKTGK